MNWQGVFWFVCLVLNALALAGAMSRGAFVWAAINGAFVVLCAFRLAARRVRVTPHISRKG